MFADEGFSGSLDHTQRPDVKELMRQARMMPKPFDVVVVHEDRAIGRKGRAFWPWVWELQDLGIFTAVVVGDYDNTTEEGESRMRKAADRAEDELIVIRNRTQGGIQEKAELLGDEGAYLGGNVPYGYRIENKGVKGESRLGPDECVCTGDCTVLHEADGVRLAAARFVATLSYEAAGDDLNRAWYRRKNGAPWDYGSVHNLLNNRVTLEALVIHRGSKDVILDREGNPRYGQPVEIKLTPILTPQELADLAAAKAKRPRRQTSKTFVYTLASRIASPCGRVYVGAGKSRQGDKHGRSPFKAMRCSGASSSVPKAKRCTCPIIRAEPVERETWRLVKKFLQDPEELHRMAVEALAKRQESGADFVGRLKGLDRRIAELEESIDLMLMAATQQAAARRLTRPEAEKYIVAMTAQSNAELADLQKQRAEIERWKEEVASVEDTAAQLQVLAQKARARLGDKTLEEQAELFDLLQTEVVIVGEVPSRPLGRPCQAGAFFIQRGLTVPHLTDEAWSRVADIVPVFSPRFPSRDILAAFLEKARTGLSWKALDVGIPHTTLMNHWIRWGAAGGLEAIMERLEGMPGTLPPDHDAVTVEVRCTVLPEALLVTPTADRNEAPETSEGSNAGEIRNRTEQPDRVAGR
ncbi:recombinase family protein [Streptomyces olivaceus]|uniref:recombinase family protein n=1 Tax=Streptomyces olivaceus TaxID=47716 RepID=UPI001CCEA8A0|nr:recombinase family protein [Streptomyces olivaceus]MBZ6258902.1 recombinase family protein [Streptomyces olivaceus]